MTDEHEIYLLSLQVEIASRLHGVCAHWSREDFQRLVKNIARVTAKYDLRHASFGYDRRQTTRLIEEMTALAVRSAEMRESGSELTA
jgi:hypothetical protein